MHSIAGVAIGAGRGSLFFGDPDFPMTLAKTALIIDLQTSETPRIGPI
jgi:hypothetical protein